METITFTDISVEISGHATIGNVRIFNTMGTVVKSENVKDQQCSIPTTDLTPGVYVIQTANNSKKFTVK